MEADNSHDFNQRLGQWIANQGFWFQLRYSMSSGGGWSIAFFHLMKIVFRVAIVLLLVAIGTFYYVIKRVDQPKFRQDLQKSLMTSTAASEAKLMGFKRLQGKAYINRVGLEGTPQSFFWSLEGANLVCNMGLLDGLTRPWDAGMIEMNWLDAEIRAGADSPEDAAAMADVIFTQYPKFKLGGFDVSDARLTWGLNEGAFGGINGSKMIASRAGDGWRLTFKGGQFSQNWIRRFDIEKLVMNLTRDGLIVEEGVLKADSGSDTGTITFKDVRVDGGEIPQISGTLVFSKVPLSSLLPDNARDIISGSISGEFELSGSTNSKDGISMKGKVNLDGQEYIAVRSGLQILEALDIVDVIQNYKRVYFEDGEFEVETGQRQMVISKLNLEAEDLMTVQGRVIVRRPTKEELAREFGEEYASEVMEMGFNPIKDDGKYKITLKEAAKASNTDDGNKAKGEDSENAEFFTSINEERRLRREAIERASRLFFFEGGVRMMIPGDAFERSRVLRERFPVDQATGRIGIDVPLQGNLANLTQDQAQEILRLSAED